MPSRPAAIVIGGGLVGCATAYYLAREGWQVRLLEKDRLGSGASSGNCGFVCPSHALPLTVPGATTRVLRTMMWRDSPVAVRWRFDPALWNWFRKFSSRCREAPMMQAARGRHVLL
jgi:D-amino-acid dehydrogenase